MMVQVVMQVMWSNGEWQVKLCWLTCPLLTSCCAAQLGTPVLWYEMINTLRSVTTCHHANLSLLQICNDYIPCAVHYIPMVYIFYCQKFISVLLVSSFNHHHKDVCFASPPGYHCLNIPMSFTGSKRKCQSFGRPGYKGKGKDRGDAVSSFSHKKKKKKKKTGLVQFSHSVMSTLCDPMDYSTPGLPVHHQLPELA